MWVYLFVAGNIMKIYDEKISNIVLPPLFLLDNLTFVESLHLCCFIASTHIRARIRLYIAYDLVDYLGYFCVNPRWHFWKFMLLPDIRYILWCAVQSLKHRKNHDPVQKPIRNWKRTSLPREAHCSALAPIRKRLLKTDRST